MSSHVTSICREDASVRSSTLETASTHCGVQNREHSQRSAHFEWPPVVICETSTIVLRTHGRATFDISVNRGWSRQLGYRRQDLVRSHYHRDRLRRLTLGGVTRLTAQRGGEVAAMRWRDVDIEQGWWTIPAAGSKNKLAHRVPLTAPALSIISALLATAKADEEYVLAGARGKREQAEAAALFHRG